MAIRNIHQDLKKYGNHKQLILDTEGLFSTERKNAKNSCQFDDHFDRAMVTFCLAVSHAVIINIRGDLDTETQDLIGICGWALG
jgi:predicted methyltransferase